MRFRADRPLGVAPATVLDYRELARRRLPRQLFDYIDGGAYEEVTMRANVADLQRVLLRQVVMRDVSVREKAVEVLGQRLAMPVILAPVGLGGMYARRGEVQAARAAHAAGVPFVESTVSICGIEEVAGAVSSPPWFQLYVMRDRGYAEELMHRAAAVGSPVLVLTIDLAVVGARHRDVRNAVAGTHTSRARVMRGIDLATHPAWVRDVPVHGRPLTFGNLERAVPGAGTPQAFQAWVAAQFDPSVTWDDVAWVREHWNGRLVVKGVLDPEDARRAIDAGVDGIVVSNHGGRQLDSVASTVRALPEVVDAVGGQAEVLVDGGVRTGLDVVKMIALGARAVMIGRAWAWAVAAGGQAAVRTVLAGLEADIDVALALTGHTSFDALDRSALYDGAPGGSRLLTEDTETLGVSGTPQLYAERVVGSRGAPVLFVHGFGVSGRLWRSSGWIREIDRLGRGWIAPDLRGHGRSDRLHDPEAYETRELVGDLIRVLDAAGVERADVIGYSLGGELAVEFAIAHPTRTHHVIAGGIGYRRPLDLDDMAALHGELTTGRTPTLTSAGRRMWATGCRTPGSDPIALAAFLAGVAASGQIAGYERLEGRVLLFAGSDDPIAAGIEAIRDRIRRAELLRLAGRDHVSAVSAPAARSRAAMLLSRT